MGKSESRLNRVCLVNDRRSARTSGRFGCFPSCNAAQLSQHQPDRIGFLDGKRLLVAASSGGKAASSIFSWLASGLLWASRWNRIRGFRELPILVKRHPSLGMLAFHDHQKPELLFQLNSGHPQSQSRLGGNSVSNLFNNVGRVASVDQPVAMQSVGPRQLRR